MIVAVAAGLAFAICSRVLFNLVYVLYSLISCIHSVEVRTRKKSLRLGVEAVAEAVVGDAAEGGTFAKFACALTCYKCLPMPLLSRSKNKKKRSVSRSRDRSRSRSRRRSRRLDVYGWHGLLLVDCFRQIIIRSIHFIWNCVVEVEAVEVVAVVAVAAAAAGSVWCMCVSMRG